MTRTDIIEWAEAHDVELVFYEPADIFDPAIVGVARRGASWFVVYDEPGVIMNMVDDAEDSSTESEKADAAYDPVAEALDNYHFNTLGAWVGDSTPAFLVDVAEDWA